MVCVGIGIYGVPAPNTSAFATLYPYPINFLKNLIIRSCQKSTYTEQRYLFDLFATPALSLRCSDYYPKDPVANWCVRCSRLPTQQCTQLALFVLVWDSDSWTTNTYWIHLALCIQVITPMNSVSRTLHIALCAQGRLRGQSTESNH